MRIASAHRSALAQGPRQHLHRPFARDIARGVHSAGAVAAVSVERPRRENGSGGAACLLDGGAGEGDVAGHLLHRQRLARQRCLVHLQQTQHPPLIIRKDHQKEPTPSVLHAQGGMRHHFICACMHAAKQHCMLALLQILFRTKGKACTGDTASP